MLRAKRGHNRISHGQNQVVWGVSTVVDVCLHRPKPDDAKTGTRGRL